MSGETIWVIICAVVVGLVLVPLIVGPSISRRRRDDSKSDWSGPYHTSDYGGSGVDSGGGFGAG
jgi:hypothetical protein